MDVPATTQVKISIGFRGQCPFMCTRDQFAAKGVKQPNMII